MSVALQELCDVLAEVEGDLRTHAARQHRFPDAQRSTRHANAIRVTSVLLQVFADGWTPSTPRP